jgi:outer membrane protein insertion porin family/translocation and assembly module TamA
LRLQLRQPGFIEARTAGFVQPELNTFPLLRPIPADKSIPFDVNTVPVPGYVEPKAAIGVNRRFGDHLIVTLAYDVVGEIPIKYKVSLDPTLPTVLIAFPELTAKLDFTDDPTHPHAGFVFNADAQYADGPTSDWAHDLRIQPDVEAYIPVARGTTLALTAGLGVLFPYNYGATVEGGALSTPASGRAHNRDIETTYFRGFFSGGPTSNRGFAVRGVSPHAFVPFLNPATYKTQISEGCGTTTAPPAECVSPVGGFTQWDASAELRVAVSGPIGVALFCDAGDVSQYVFPSAGSLRFNYLHMSCGVGARYDTPVGPLRLDVAYRLPWLQIVGYASEAAAAQHDPTFGADQPRLLDLPVALALGIGEAF